MTINYKKILNLTLTTIAIIAGIYLIFRLSLFFIPFIVALVISSLLEPLILFVVKKTKLSRKASAIIVISIAMSTVSVLLFFMILKLTTELISFSYTLPDFFSKTYINISSIIHKAAELYFGLPVEITSNINNIISSISDTLLVFANNLIRGILNAISSIPNAIVFTIVTILSIYFFSIDKASISSFFKDNMPVSWTNKIRDIRNDMFSALFGYIRSQLIMMSITFTELLIGFTIVGIKPTLLLALILCVIDALPIIGLGTALIPWAIYNMFTDNFNLAISLLVIYVIAVIVRQLVEPRVLSHQIGVHPILTLMGMYGGLKMFGILGLILGPVSVLLIKNIVSGYLKNKKLIKEET